MVRAIEDDLNAFSQGAAYRDDDAKFAGAALERVASRRDEAFYARERFGLDVACKTRALRAKMTVLGTPALFGVVEHFDCDSIAATRGAHVVGER